MKKYIQSIAYIAFIAATFFAIITAIKSYEKPFNFYENPLVWIAIVALVLVILLKELLNITALNKAEKLQMEKDGITPEKEDNWAWAKKLISKWTEAKAIEEEDEIILDHNYDGIKELDNTLPPWWVYMFYATILFAVVYLVRFEVLDGDTQIVEYNKAVAQAKKELEAFKTTSKDAFIDAETVVTLTSERDLKRGKAIYKLNCVSCHLNDGGGSIGPNLTDEYWILGGGIKNVFSTIYNGGRDGKGMIAWNKTLKPIDIQKVASYILTMQGTTPAKPKASQGELYKDDSQSAKKDVIEQVKDSLQ